MLKNILLLVCVSYGAIAAQTISSVIPVYKDGDASHFQNSGASKVVTITSELEDRIGWTLFDTRNRDLLSVEQAYFSLYIHNVVTPGTIKIFALSETIPYSEFDVRYEDIKFDEDQPVAACQLTASNTEHSIQFDVTSAVKATPFYGFAILCDDGGQFAIESKEGSSAPFIVLSYAVANEAARWLNGSGSPENEIGNDGDFYLDSENSDVYTKSSDAWGVISNIHGERGAQGPKGEIGPSGVQGPSGPQGEIGPAGTPGVIGPAGPVGPIGADGVAGLSGPRGEPGAEGLSGKDGRSVIWRGGWDSTVTYSIDDVVEYDGSAYISIRESSKAKPCDSISIWQVLVQRGAQGPKGEIGQSGMEGPSGPQGEIGPAGLIGPTGAEGVAGPAGPQGEPGIVGPAGPSGSFQWIVVRDSTLVVQPNTGYIPDTTICVNLSLSNTFNPGDILKVTGSGAGGWKISQLAGQSILVDGLTEQEYIGWKTINTDNLWWISMANSEDCSKIWVAPYPQGQIRYTEDEGVSWTLQGQMRDWMSICASADGVNLAAVEYQGLIYLSHDGGATWTGSESTRAWCAITCSADGNRIAAVVYPGLIYISTDGGVNWDARGSVQKWAGIASSADGMRLAAIVDGGYIYLSSDGGLTWTPSDTVRFWKSIQSSADGMRLSATCWGLGLTIRVSNDGGITWFESRINKAVWDSWSSHAVSSDGMTIVAVDYDGLIYSSFDGGTSWNTSQSNDSWWQAALSSDGSKLITAKWGGAIMSSSLFKSPVTSTSVGVSGSLSGGLGSTIELQYLGNNRFLLMNSTGTITAK